MWCRFCLKSVYLICFALALLEVNLVLAGTVYQWVDNKGNTHFGDKPPQSAVPVHKIETPTAAATTPEFSQRRLKQQKLLNAFKSERLEREAKRNKARKEAADLDKRCAGIRHNLALLQRSNLLYNKDKNGTRRYASNAQRAQIINQMQALLKEHC